MSANMKRLKREPGKHGDIAHEFGRHAAKGRVVSLFWGVVLGIVLPIVFPIMRSPNLFTIIGIIMIITAIAEMIVSKKKDAALNLKNYCAEKSIDYTEIEQEWEKAVVYRSGGNVIALGEKHLIMCLGAYKWENVRQIYGSEMLAKNIRGTTMLTDCLRICLDDGNHIDCTFSKKDAVVFLNDIKQKHPNVVAGHEIITYDYD